MVIEFGEPKFRAQQIIDGVIMQCAKNYSEIKNIPASLSEKFNQKRPLFSLIPHSNQASSNGDTIKLAQRTADGSLIETVIMKFKDGRNSVCVSCQIGCQMGCKFCATGKMGFKRNLTAEEIQDQVILAHQALAKSDQKLTNIVYMGMGEPFMNYQNVKESIENIHDLLNFAYRRITVSTSGLVDGIEKLANDLPQVNLAISLHAPNQQTREQIMPIAKMYDIDKLLRITNQYFEKTHRRVTYEYILLKDINDSEKDAVELADFLQKCNCHVNLIPFNPTPTDKFDAPSKKNILDFQKTLQKHKINATVRVAMGQDIDAACGQLATKLNN